MRAILLFLSSLLAFVSFSAKAQLIDTDSSESRSQRYAFQIETKKAAITGILITKESDESITGCMINEFGVSAISFIYSKDKDKVQLVDVVSFLNKWYIKSVLKNDINFCIHTLYDIPYNKKHKYEVTTDQGQISISNNKRHLKYIFSPLNTSESNDTQESII